MYEDLNERRIATLHPTVARMAREWLRRVTAEGIDVLVTQALRTIEEQDALYAQGRSKPGNIVTQVRGGYSYHNYGLAVDFCLLDANGKAIWTVNNTWRRVAEIGKEVGFAWGGDWKGFIDYPHLEYTFGLTTTQLRNGVQPPEDTYREEDEPMTADERQAFEELKHLVNTQAEKIQALESQRDVSMPEWASAAAAHFSSVVDTKSGSYDFWRILTILYRAQTGEAPEWAKDVLSYYGDLISDKAGSYEFWRILKIVSEKDAQNQATKVNGFK